jgi:DDE superfamily endonuclease
LHDVVKLLVDEFTTKITRCTRSFGVLVYPSGIDLSSSALRHLAGLLAARRREVGTRWRRLPVGRQALLVLAHLRCGHTYAQLAAGFGVGTTTVYRYVVEAVQVLAAGAPDLMTAARVVARKAFVILDGTLLPIDRIAADRPYYSGKHHKHGMNVQVNADPFGRLVWASPALPGAVHDIRAARTHGIIDTLTSEDVPCWADKAYQGAGGTVRVPYRGRWETLSTGQQAHNRSHARIRALGEQAVATLKSWRLLRKLRCSTTRITNLVKAILALHLASSN